MPTLRLTVERGTPRHLCVNKAAAPSVGLPTLTRVPTLRSRGLIWNLPASELRGRTGDALATLECLEIGDNVLDDVNGVIWPPALKTHIRDSVQPSNQESCVAGVT